MTLIPTLTPTSTQTATATRTATITSTPSRTPGVAILQSIAAHDGWVLEKSENSNTGGSLNAADTNFDIGDDSLRRQYRDILSFATGSLPDNAIITNITLKLSQSGIASGGLSLAGFQGFMIDIKNGVFGIAALQASDFQAAASKSYGPFNFSNTHISYSIDLTSAKAYINKLATNDGLTQIRLRFKLDDNNNKVANFISLYSGNALAANRPQLVITYIVP